MYFRGVLYCKFAAFANFAKININNVMIKNNIKIQLLFIILILCLGCNNTSSENQEHKIRIELKGNLSGAEFKEAIIGKWGSVFYYPDKENIEYLELDKNGNAKIIIEKDTDKKEFKGNYTINFLRPPAKSMITFAEIIIKTSGYEIVLSRVNFGMHNGVPYKWGNLLRIDSEPPGVLLRTDSEAWGDVEKMKRMGIEKIKRIKEGK
jgi:hypothetical protein